MTTSKANDKSDTQQSDLKLGYLLLENAVAAPVGALIYGTFGKIGQYSLSFFKPAMAKAAGSFARFAGMGALAATFLWIPLALVNYCFQSSPFFKAHPRLKTFLESTSDLLLNLGAITASAAILGFPPLGASVICMMIIPTVIFALTNLVNVIRACLDLTVNGGILSASYAPA